VQELVRKADAGAGPALKRLPDIAQGLQAVVDRAGKLVGSADVGYGENSQFRRDLQRLLEQVSDTARSVRLLADYLDQHPEALLRGRGGRLGDR
jgi:paraquat-inducible protein B